jgi:hypothetical protein
VTLPLPEPSTIVVFSFSTRIFLTLLRSASLTFSRHEPFLDFVTVGRVSDAATGAFPPPALHYAVGPVNSDYGGADNADYFEHLHGNLLRVVTLLVLLQRQIAASLDWLVPLLTSIRQRLCLLGSPRLHIAAPLHQTPKIACKVPQTPPV